MNFTVPKVISITECYCCRFKNIPGYYLKKGSKFLGRRVYGCMDCRHCSILDDTCQKTLKPKSKYVQQVIRKLTVNFIKAASKTTLSLKNIPHN